MAFVSHNYAYDAAGAAVVTAPTGIQDGDILVVAVFATMTGIGSVTHPSGFTVVTDASFSTSARRHEFSWKRASSESGDYTVSCTDAKVFAWVGCYRGRVASGSPIDIYSNTGYVTNDLYVVAAGMTIATAGSDVIWLGHYYSTIQEPSAPSGMTLRQVITDGNKYRAYICDLVNQATGATGDKDSVLPTYSTATKHATMVALKPAASAGISIPLLNHLLLGD